MVDHQQETENMFVAKTPQLLEVAFGFLLQYVRTLKSKIGKKMIIQILEIPANFNRAHHQESLKHFFAKTSPL